MNTKIKRIIALILALSMIVCCFSACKGEEEEEETKPTVLGPEGDNFDDWATDDMPIDDSWDNNTNDPTNNNGSADAWDNGSNNNSSGNNDYWDNSGSYPNNNGTGNNSGSNNNGSTSNRPSWDDIHNGGHDAEEEFFKNFDTPEERNEILKLAGYEYDETQDIYYTHLNPWQRYFGFTDLYDDAAPLTNMWYLTLKIDFKYKDLLWRLQWWKGQYGVLEGAELGVYTKEPDNNGAFYECASDERLLTMSFDFYHSISDYNKGNILFTRTEQEHWWLTGFKFGVVDPQKCVVRATLYAYDEEMADGIEAGLKAVTDDKGNWNGFTQYREGTTRKNFYVRKGNRFSVIWVDAGYVNWSWMTPENPEAPNPDVNIPEESSTNAQ